jgi:hypothetical protein
MHGRSTLPDDLEDDAAWAMGQHLCWFSKSGRRSRHAGHLEFKLKAITDRGNIILKVPRHLHCNLEVAGSVSEG